MKLNKYDSLEMSELSSEELVNTNGGIFGLVVCAALLLGSSAVRVAATGLVVAAAAHVAKDGYQAGYNSAH